MKQEIKRIFKYYYREIRYINEERYYGFNKGDFEEWLEYKSEFDESIEDVVDRMLESPSVSTGWKKAIRKYKNNEINNEQGNEYTRREFITGDWL